MDDWKELVLKNFDGAEFDTALLTVLATAQELTTDIIGG